MRVGIDCRKAADYGIGTYIRGLVRGLAELSGPDEFVLFAPPDLHELLPARFERVAVSSPHYSVRELFAFKRFIGERKLDLFHAPHYVVPFTSAPTVVTIHDLIHLKIPVWRRHPLAPAYARWMMRRATRKAVKILTGTQTVRNDVAERYPDAKGKIVVTPFGIDRIFQPGEASGPTLSRHGLAENRYFLFVGNDKPHKNLDALASAYRKFREEHGHIALALVGGVGRFRDAGIIQTGFVAESDLPHLYRGALALILPSLEEGFGLPVVEAMACGTPAIISTHPALLEVAGEAALAVEPRSIEAIAGAMTRLAEDSALRDQLATRGLARAKNRSWRSCAESTLMTYRAALEVKVA